MGWRAELVRSRPSRSGAAQPRPQLPWIEQGLPALFAPVDISFLIFFRIFFAAMVLWALWEFHAKNLITSLYVEAPFHFTYHGFSWVRPWPGEGTYWHFGALAILAVLVMMGFLYRLSALLLWLGFTYVFLLEKAEYQNHNYLICLLCFLLIFLPAHRAWSVDGLWRPGIGTVQVPAWTLWLLRFQIGLPYLFGGIAKLKSDWLCGQPMQMWLSISPWRVLLGPLTEEHWLALVVSWGGMLFDLAIVPLLLWRPTRTLAFGGVIVFHLLNAFMFNIGVFPWLMIGATTVFFEPDWPRHIITAPSLPARTPPGAPEVTRPGAPALTQKLIAGAFFVYVLLHLVLPFRYLLYPGNVLWTEQGYFFAWKMMLRAKVTALRFLVIDRATEKTIPSDPARWLTPMQLESMGHDPEMMREFAHFLREKYQEKGQDVEVRVLALCSLNGRKPQFLVDPTVDLSRQPRTWFHQPYIVPLLEPFRWDPWNIPVAQWEKVLAGPDQK